MKRPPRLLGMAEDREGCLFQALVVGQALFGLAAMAAPRGERRYLIWAAVACIIGWFGVAWRAMR